MKELKDVEKKENVAKEIGALVKQINEIIDSSPYGLKIMFVQNNALGPRSSHLSVFISEEITYPK